jgi:rRNA-processing protein FCF1
MNLYKEVIACKMGDNHRFKSSDEAYEATLDEQLRSFDEIYVDTAPIIQEDWFLHFVSDAEPILKRRKKKLIILEKTLEELHGLKDNQEKDKEVRIRSTIRPEMIRSLARKGLVRIGDTGSVGIADDHLVNLFAVQGKTKNLMLVTQDRGLSERIVNLSHEMMQEPGSLEKGSFFKRLFGKKDDLVPKTHQMIACKLIEDGKLKRCYICPECKESYYDDLLDCDGIVLCGRCYLDLKEKDAKLEAEQQMQRELEVKQEEERKKKLQQEELARLKEKQQVTVEQTINRKKRKYLLLAIMIFVIVILLVVQLI